MHDILLYVIALLFGTAIFALLGILGLLTKYDANNDTRKNVDGSRKSKVRLSNASHRVRSSNAGKRTNHEHEKAENVECYTELKVSSLKLSRSLKYSITDTVSLCDVSCVD